jgi:hypothetical protein
VVILLTCRRHLPALQVLLPVLIDICILPPVQRCPHGLVLEQPHGFDILSSDNCQLDPLPLHTQGASALPAGWTHISLIRRKAMIYPRRQHQQIILFQSNPYPLVPLAAHVEIPVPVQDVPDLLVLVQVLFEEHLDLVFVDGAHLVGRDGDFVAVLVGALRRNGVDGRDTGAVPVEDAERREVGFRDRAAGVVGRALVAGQVVVVVCFHFGALSR